MSMSMSTATLCLHCGGTREEHLQIPTIAQGMALICLRATYQSTSTKGGTTSGPRDPLPLDAMPVAPNGSASPPSTSVIPGSPASMGQVWDAAAHKGRGAWKLAPTPPPPGEENGD